MNFLLLVGAIYLTAWIVGHAIGWFLARFEKPLTPQEIEQARLAEVLADEGIRLDKQKKLAAWRSKYNKYLKSEEWQWVRQRVLDNANHKCKDCGELATQVHHLKYTKAQRAGEFKLENYAYLIAICDGCHRKRHGLKKDKSNQANQPMPVKHSGTIFHQENLPLGFGL